MLLVSGHTMRVRSGIQAAIAAYVLWGLFPLYWGFLEPATPWEVLAARVIFSLVCLASLVSVMRDWSKVGAVVTSPRNRRLLTFAAIVVSLNWGTYIWGVANDRVVDASLGYFINPLVSVGLGVVVLGERLRAMQWLALALATGSVVYSTLAIGRLPWVSLVLAVSFAFYGLAKKLAGVPAIPSLTCEMIFLTPFALAYIALLATRGQLEFGSNGVGHALLMFGAGPVTSLPLLLFGYAAHRVPLSVLGPLQYLAPTIQLAIGVWVLGEPMPAQRWFGFVGVWAALVLFTVDGLRSARRSGVRGDADPGAGMEPLAG